MKTKDLLIITGTAVTTAAATFALVAPASLNADGELTLPSKISQPRLRKGGLEFTVTAKDRRLPKAGEPLALELKVNSVTNAPVTACIRLALSASSPADALSRAIRLPTILWQREELVTMAPNETKVLQLNTVSSVPVGKIVSVTLQEVTPGHAPDTVPTLAGKLNPGLLGPGFVGLTFSTAPAEKDTALLLAQKREAQRQVPKLQTKSVIQVTDDK